MENKYSDITFKRSGDHFIHNLSNDYAYFALWKTAAPFYNRIKKVLEEDFEVLLDTRLTWSETHFDENASRLYEAPIFAGKSIKSEHRDKIGNNTFIVIAVKDKNPDYTLAQSVSGKIEMSNLNIVKAKYQFRDWIEQETGLKYGVHSTNNILEFFFQMPLLLGADRFETILSNQKIEAPEIKKDLEGAQGWNNYREVFKILNLCTNYLVQRSFETLPDENPEKDIDLLTDNYQRLASVLGMRQSSKQPYKGHIMVNGEEISIDVRFVGDKYYDIAWQNDMLKRKMFRNGIFCPRIDDYFFSLLFHCKAQKPTIKEKYRGILKDLAETMKFDWFSPQMLDDDKQIGGILSGYFSANNYCFETPIDRGVYCNNTIVKHLPKANIPSKKSMLVDRGKDNIKRILPDKIIELLKRVLNK